MNTVLNNSNCKTITHKEIGDSYLPSFGIVESNSTEQSSTTANEKKKINLDIPILSDHQKRAKFFDIMAHKTPQQTLRHL